MKGLWHAISSRKSLTVSLGVIFLYSATLAYAVGGPFSPHQTLDPDCLPTATTCYVTSPSGGGGISIGDSVGGGTPGQVLYTDNSGNVVSDGGFTRDSVTNDTDIRQTVGNNLSGLTLASNVVGTGIIGSFNINLNTSNNILSLSGAGDISSLAGTPANGSLMLVTDTMNQNTSAATGVISQGGNIFAVTNVSSGSNNSGLQITATGGGFFSSDGTYQAGLNFSNSYSTVAFSLNNGTNTSSFTALPSNRCGSNTTEARIQSNNIAWSFPCTAGTAGQVLSTDGNGNLSWVNAGGSSVAGSNGQVQYNNNGSVGADAGLVYDKNTPKLTVAGNGTPNVSGPSFTGSGLNDLSGDVNGYDFAYSDLNFTVTIDGTGSPNTFSWSDDQGDSGSNVSITGVPQILAHGITITFSSTTGHTYNNQWTFTAHSAPTTTAPPTFTGTGSNDFSTFGSYNGAGTTNYTVTIDSLNSTFLGLGSTTGSFVVGETINDTNSGATATLLNIDQGGNITVGSVSGTFNVFDTVTGATSGAMSTLSGTIFFTDTFTWTDGATTEHYRPIDSYNSLSNGINFSFGSQTGHTVNDQWSFSGIHIPILINQSFLGSGINDLFVQGSGYDNAYSSVLYTVTINTAGSPDTFDWYDNVGGSGSNIPINGNSQVLSHGVGISFSRLDGHTAGNQWTFNVSKVVVGSVEAGSEFDLNGSLFATTNPNYSVFLGHGVSYSAIATNSFFEGYNAGTSNNVDNSIFMGYSAGSNAGGSYASNFMGYGAGQYSPNSYGSNFFGYYAGSGTSAYNSNFEGYSAGNSATNAYNSNFFGYYTGETATNAHDSIFMGYYSGFGAGNAYNSTFLGYNSGYHAGGANNSIFIGNNSGQFDSVDNSSGGSSILIGDNTSTNGHSNSIAIGRYATNTMSNQFLIGSSYTNIDIAGVNYVFPNSQASASGYVLTNDGNGNLSWAAGGGPITIQNGTSLFSTGLFGTSSSSTYANFIGYAAGAQSTGSDYSNFLGFQSGDISSGATNSTFIGSYAGQGSSGASNSIFMGPFAGDNSQGANDAIFLGYQAGIGDVVNNSSGGSSILIGDNTHTGGFQNSIAIGANAQNTMSNQFLVGSSYTNWDIAGVNYAWPTSQASSSGYVLTNDGSGNLTWAAAGGSNPITLENTNSLVSTGLGTVSSAQNSIFLGYVAGGGSNGADHSNFIGYYAGNNAGNASYSNFIGDGAGEDATGAFGSNFMGIQAGRGALKANNSIFIGSSAGFQDSVDNTAFGSSILIGNNSSTNGYPNSIALGTSAHNTMSNQFLVASSYTNWDIAGVNYAWPTSQASSSGYVLTNDGNGNLTWAIPSGLIGSTSGVSSSSTPGSTHETWLGAGAGANAANLYTTFIGTYTGAGATSANYSTFIGEGAGADASNGSDSTFVGELAGAGAANASNSIFVGEEAGYYYHPGPQFGTTNAANSIFIGNGAGNRMSDAALDNTSGGWSILVGNGSSTGGYSNSIALGSSTTNTASNQFMIGSNNSSTTRIDTLVFNGGSGNTCSLDIPNGLNCSSDIRLKTNIVDLPLNTLDTLTKLKTITYNWMDTSVDTKQHIGFEAQDVLQYYPQLVSQNTDGMYSVNYANMTPVIVEALRELNLKITPMIDLTTTNNSFVGQLIAWLGNSANGITDLFAKTIHSDSVKTNQLCVGATCVTEAQLQQLLQNQSSQSGGGTPTSPSIPVVIPLTTPTDPTTPTPLTTPDPTPTPPVVVTPPVIPDPTPTPIVTSPVTPTPDPTPIPPTPDAGTTTGGTSGN